MLEILLLPVTVIFILVVVMAHHETLTFITRWYLPRISKPHRWHVGATVLILIAAHVVEILVYGVGLYLVGEHWLLGSLAGVDQPDIQTYLYFSFASYTSLGIGDIYPLGFMRFLAGVEALVGLLMIGWTASFIYLEMRTFWNVS